MSPAVLVVLIARPICQCLSSKAVRNYCFQRPGFEIVVGGDVTNLASTSINPHPPTSSDIHRHPPIYPHSLISTHIHPHPPTSTDTSSHPPTSTHIHRYPPTSTDTHPHPPTSTQVQPHPPTGNHPRPEWLGLYKRQTVRSKRSRQLSSVCSESVSVGSFSLQWS